MFNFAKVIIASRATNFGKVYNFCLYFRYQKRYHTIGGYFIREIVLAGA